MDAPIGRVKYPPGPCAAADCAKDHARGNPYCSMHYSRLLRNGSPDAVQALRGVTMEDRLLHYSAWAESGCLEWTGHRVGKGYGRVRDHDRKLLAHRAAYALWVGPIPEGLQVLHWCDNPPCINPEHLHVGTNQENQDERWQRTGYRHD